jgi:hypothetical protein
MPGPMPYLLDKSPYFEIIEDLLKDPAQRISILESLRNGDPIAGLVGFDSTNLGAPAKSNPTVPAWGDGRSPDERVTHLNEEWFGMTDATGKWLPQPGVFPTGFWSSYQGDPEAIVRAAMICAIEVSLDLPPGTRGDPLPDANTLERRWPIDVYWICQGPWFQCWVLWRQSGPSNPEGHVTLLITTPAAVGYPLESKITRPLDPTQPAYTKPEYASPPPPDARTNEQGMWVIGHADYKKTVNCATEGTLLGKIMWPTIEWRAIDPGTVVCVAPAEWEGGVLHDGRPYVP